MKDEGTTATIPKALRCINCGWPVIQAVCNGNFNQFADAGDWDWWQYCSNKGCEYHHGEGVCQEQPDWVLDYAEIAVQHAIEKGYNNYQEDIRRKLLTDEFHDLIKKYGGIPYNCSITYISVAVLNGMVNYLDNPQAFLINRYGLLHDPEKIEDHPFLASNKTTYRKKYELSAQYMADQPHTRLLEFDDVIFFGETDNSLYCFWFDRDSADCTAERLLKETFPGLTLDRYSELFMKDMVDRYADWATDTENHNAPIITRIPGVRGWISG